MINMKNFKWADKDAVNKFHKNLADAWNTHVNKEFVKDRADDKPLEDIDRVKTLKEIWDEYKKENDIDEVSTRPLNIDAERYSWLAHFDGEGNLKNDKVNSPKHYKLRGLDIEAIDVIRGALTEDEFRGFCKGNVLKYTIREGHKNGDEDLKKAKKYLDFLEKDDSDE